MEVNLKTIHYHSCHKNFFRYSQMAEGITLYLWIVFHTLKVVESTLQIDIILFSDKSERRFIPEWKVI